MPEAQSGLEFGNVSSWLSARVLALGVGSCEYKPWLQHSRVFSDGMTFHFSEKIDC